MQQRGPLCPGEPASSARRLIAQASGSMNASGRYLPRSGEYRPPSARGRQAVSRHSPGRQGAPNGPGGYRPVRHPCRLQAAKRTLRNSTTSAGRRSSHDPSRRRADDFSTLTGGGLISAILRRQSASESCGPETNVPLTLVLYQPDTTPSRSDSSVLTWRGERFCMVCVLSGGRSIVHRARRKNFRLLGEQPFAQPSLESRSKSASTALTRSR